MGKVKNHSNQKGNKLKQKGSGSGKGVGDRNHGKKKKIKKWRQVREKKTSSSSVSQSPRKQEKPPTPKDTSSSTLRSRMLERLSIARFRTLNASIDSSPTPKKGDSNPLANKQTFESYHTGFTTASSLWKQNPLDLISDWIRKSVPKEHVIADFGCGTGSLAKSIPNKTYSFDLVAVADHVTECDMTDVPLDDASVHVAIFSLSLMGNDVTRFFIEARRVLKKGGLIKIAEAASRLQGQNMRKFISGMRDIGFKKISIEEIGGGAGKSHVFVIMEFRKIETVNKKHGSVTLGACVYKKR